MTNHERSTRSPRPRGAVNEVLVLGLEVAVEPLEHGVERYAAARLGLGLWHFLLLLQWVKGLRIPLFP
jgi:hypothetical protein